LALLHQMFYLAAAFDQDLSPWNVDAVTTMQSMFNGATAFSQTLCWDISGKTTTDMFAGTGSGGSVGEALTDSNFQTACDAWVSNPTTATATYGNIKFWNTGAVTNMDFAFQSKGSFNDDISLWDVSSVTTMRNMFENAAAFNQPIGGWDVSQVTDMYVMFTSSAFNQDIGLWDVIKVSLSMFQVSNEKSISMYCFESYCGIAKGNKITRSKAS
jgi:surface protein